MVGIGLMLRVIFLAQNGTTQDSNGECKRESRFWDNVQLKCELSTPQISIIEVHTT